MDEERELQDQLLSLASPPSPSAPSSSSSSGTEDDDTDTFGGEAKLLWRASRRGDISAVKSLLEKKGEDAEKLIIVEAEDSDGYRALHKAAYNGHADVIDYLLRR